MNILQALDDRHLLGASIRNHGDVSAVAGFHGGGVWAAVG